MGRLTCELKRPRSFFHGPPCLEEPGSPPASLRGQRHQGTVRLSLPPPQGLPPWAGPSDQPHPAREAVPPSPEPRGLGGLDVASKDANADGHTEEMQHRASWGRRETQPSIRTKSCRLQTYQQPPRRKTTAQSSGLQPNRPQPNTAPPSNPWSPRQRCLLSLIPGFPVVNETVKSAFTDSHGMKRAGTAPTQVGLQIGSACPASSSLANSDSTTLLRSQLLSPPKAGVTSGAQ